MVRLGVISDSHHSDFWVARYLEKANRERYDAVIHLGDGASDVRWLKDRLEMPLYAVAGNCDFRCGLDAECALQFENHRILAAHGHRYDVKYGYDALSYRAEEIGADIALSGHTHWPHAGYVGRVLVLNPGALQDGRCAELMLDGARTVPRLLRLDGAFRR